MLNRGLLAGLEVGSYRSSFRQHWNWICTLSDIRKAYAECARDVLGYRASAGASRSITSLVNERFALLGRQIGQEFDLTKLAKKKQSERMSEYEAFLKREYNLSRAEAADLLDRAMQQESAGYKNARNRTRQ